MRRRASTAAITSAPRGRAVGDGPFLDVAILPEAVELWLAGRDGVEGLHRVTGHLDRYLALQYDAELDQRLALAPAPAKMVKGGRA